MKLIWVTIMELDIVLGIADAAAWLLLTCRVEEDDENDDAPMVEGGLHDTYYSTVTAVHT